MKRVTSKADRDLAILPAKNSEELGLNALGAAAVSRDHVIFPQRYCEPSVSASRGAHGEMRETRCQPRFHRGSLHPSANLAQISFRKRSLRIPSMAFSFLGL